MLSAGRDLQGMNLAKEMCDWLWDTGRTCGSGRVGLGSRDELPNHTLQSSIRHSRPKCE